MTNTEVQLINYIEQNNLKKAKMLLKNNAINLNKLIDNSSLRGGGHTYLTYALSEKNYEFVLILIEYGADINFANVSESTPLMWAASCFLELVKMFIKRGANIDAVDHGRHTALMTAALYGKYDIMDYLLKAGANPSIKNDRGNDFIIISKATSDIYLSQYEIQDDLLLKDKTLYYSFKNKKILHPDIKIKYEHMEVGTDLGLLY